jgi:sec-independent protein translocase protein TatB
MFDIGWTEMLVIAVVGPKDLPKMLRTFGKTTAKLRSMAGDFQKQFNEALKEAELDDVRKSVESLRGLNPTAEIKKQLNPFQQAANDVRAGLDSAMKPTPKPTVADSADALPAEPLKAGATVMPGVSGPDALPAAQPVFPAGHTPAGSGNGAAPAPARKAASGKPARSKVAIAAAVEKKASATPKVAAPAKTATKGAVSRKKPAGTPN